MVDKISYKVWDDIKNTYEFAKSNQENPQAYILGGQPGAGKSFLTKNIRKELKENIIEINGDDFRKYHPDFKEFQDKFGQDSPKYTASFAGAMTEAILDKAIKEKYNVIVEGTFRTSETPQKTLKLLKDNGYETNVHIKTCNQKDSWQSCIERYNSMLEVEPQEARYTDKAHHDLVVKNLGRNVRKVFQSGLVDNMRVFSREKELFNSKEKTFFQSKIIDKELGIYKAPKKIKEFKKMLKSKESKGIEKDR